MAGPSAIEASPEEVIVDPTIAQETTPLLGNKPDDSHHDAEAPAPESDVTPSTPPPNTRSVIGIISVLLIGVFVSQADTTLVMATFAQISSEFGDLDSGSWLLSSYMLAACITQPIYGKISDIFGRKVILQTSYAIFVIGTAASGFSRNMTQMILGRVIQGAGGAGMVSMVSVLLTDLVPLQEVAQYRSYVNIFSTVGRSCGGLVGGYLTQVIGWRYTFLCQCPLLLLSIVLVWWKLEEPKVNDDPEQSISTKLKRIDFLGAFFMSTTLLSFLLAFDMASDRFSWRHPLIIGLLISALLSSILFSLTETYWAKEPIFPLRLLRHYAVVTSYLILSIQTAIQVAVSTLLPSSPGQVTNTPSAHVPRPPLLPSNPKRKHRRSRRAPAPRNPRQHNRRPASRRVDKAHRALQATHHSIQYLRHALFHPPDNLLARKNQCSAIPAHFPRRFRDRNGAFCCVCWINGGRGEAGYRDCGVRVVSEFEYWGCGRGVGG